MKKIIFFILISTISCTTLNKLSHLEEDIDGWWFLNFKYLTCSDTDIDKIAKPTSMEENYKILDGGCTRKYNPNKDILLLTCYLGGQKTEFVYFKTENACAKFVSEYKQQN